MKRRREVLREEVREGSEELAERENLLRRREESAAAKRRTALEAKGGVALRWISATGADALTGAGVGLPAACVFLGGLPGSGLVQVAIGVSVGALVGLVVGIQRAQEAFD